MNDVHDNFTFEFSLTVLDHLGRHLYRNFITVIGEAISNAWDADAHNVWITIDHDSSMMVIKDDGVGMSPDSMQNRFLKIGYSKRKDPEVITRGKRPFIGAKGIGKLALLSCASTVTVVSKADGYPVTSCVIDNNRLDQAIDKDQTTQEINLPAANTAAHKKLDNLLTGTVLIFDHPRMPNSTDVFLKKAIALFFRFSLLDPDFAIHYNGHTIGAADASDLAESTQYIWTLGDHFTDPYLDLVKPTQQEKIPLTASTPVGTRGFLATVRKPRDLAILGSGERIGVDLFVNGRLRERNILRHRPTSRVTTQYLYGQIHVDSLDTGDTDPFTSSREAVLEDNSQFAAVLDFLDSCIRHTLLAQWDEWRLADNLDGDDENTKVSKKDRAARKLVDQQVKEFFGTRSSRQNSPLFDRLLKKSQEYLIPSLDDYSRIFLFENLLRQICREFSYELSTKNAQEATKHKNKAETEIKEFKITDHCRSNDDLLWYSGLTDLIATVEKYQKEQGRNSKNMQAYLQNPKGLLAHVRNIVMHTTGLTTYGREQLRAILDIEHGALRKIVADVESTRRREGSK